MGDGTTQIGPFEVVLVEPSEGAEVYRTVSGRKLIVKLFRDPVPPSTYLSMLTDLEHPNVAGVLEVGTHDGQPFVVQEAIDAQAIARLTRFAPLGSRAAIEIVRDAAAALTYAERLGVTHPHLSADNVLVNHEHRGIVDFAVVRPRAAEPSDAARRLTVLLWGMLTGMPATEPSQEFVTQTLRDSFSERACEAFESVFSRCLYQAATEQVSLEVLRESMERLLTSRSELPENQSREAWLASEQFEQEFTESFRGATQGAIRDHLKHGRSVHGELLGKPVVISPDPE